MARQPPETKPGSHGLAETLDLEHEIGLVHAEQGPNRFAVVSERPVHIVLEDEEPTLRRQFEKSPAPLQRQRHAGRSVEGSDRVEELEAAPIGLQPIEFVLERLDLEAVIVDWDRTHIRARFSASSRTIPQALVRVLVMIGEPKAALIIDHLAQSSGIRGASRATYSPNTNSARPAATRITCRPSTVNEIGGDFVLPPSATRQTSRPVSASKAKQTPPDAPNTNPRQR